MFELLNNTRIQNKKELVIQIRTDILNENPELANLLNQSNSIETFFQNLKEYLFDLLKNDINAFQLYNNQYIHGKAEPSNRSIAVIRLLDYIDNNGLKLDDLSNNSIEIINRPLEILFQYLKFNEIVSVDFAYDFLYLFRQLSGYFVFPKATKKDVENWMQRHSSGLDNDVILERKENKDRIIRILINKIDKGEIVRAKYNWPENTSFEEKLILMNKWWNDKTFHLQFAVRNPILLNELLDNSFDAKTMDVLHKAVKKGIPFFVNLHYLSLLNTKAKGNDLTIRQYVIYSQELIDEFGNIKAWEKEDIVEPGKPNAAGWLLPSHDSVHRRYPEVAILIPSTMGRACAGLCVSCQRMYGFQRGDLNFNLDKLSPEDTWPKRLKRYLDYFENDSQLRDILITGGDAFMSSDKSLKKILDAVYDMAKRKKEANTKRPDGEKYAEMLRVRLGTRIFAYLPQRITPDLIKILKEFKEKAAKIGLKQFVVQTHFESAMEITPEAKNAIENISKAGWLVTNQLVLTSAAARRGHTAKLRKVLNDIGVIPYYTFTVKGFNENIVNFATNARAVQELKEEKIWGRYPDELNEKINSLVEKTIDIAKELDEIRNFADIPFLATDKTVLNLPGVGKSLGFRVIGLSLDGRRILRFDHDSNRKHSPIIQKMEKVDIIESKSIYSFLMQLKEFGEDIQEYESIWNYSFSYSEKRASIFEYPDYDFNLTKNMTNLQID